MKIKLLFTMKMENKFSVAKRIRHHLNNNKILVSGINFDMLIKQYN